jgi:hypothetical protein
VAKLGRLSCGISSSWAGFSPSVVHVVFLMCKVPLGNVLLHLHFGFPLKICHSFYPSSTLRNLWSRQIRCKYNLSVNNTTLYFKYNKNSVLSGRHMSTFIGSSSGPLRKQIQELSTFQGDMFRPLLGHLQTLWENRSKIYLYFRATCLGLY